MRSTAVIMNDAMKCLIEKLGVLETEVFISNLLREPFDYTEWQRTLFENDTPDELYEKAVEYCKNNPIE